MIYTYKEGDLVQLKSGVPPMIVESMPGKKADMRQGPGKYWCTWFKGATRDSDGFKEHVLQPYFPPQK